ncbi:redoxin family protein [Tenacibaculum sp.]|uniref:TlpA family protein disulfide reductase n=1 Tax=Tenacibaculum sp. TaxID=1906242 RepID=UPI003D0D43C4
MKLNRKTITNIIFVVIIGLLLYPPTKVYFIRLISFAPSAIQEEKREQLNDYTWSLKGLNTANIDFNALKNKVVFVNFWATWCPPCIAEMPSIQKLYDDYKDKVEFVFVSNENWTTIESFYKEKEYNLPTYNILSRTPDQLVSNSIPATFILDKNGTIMVDKRGPADWSSQSIRELLDKLIEQKTQSTM